MTDINYELTPDDLIYHTSKNGEIKAGGFSINSTLLKQKIPVVKTGGKKQKPNININITDSDNKVSDKFDNMVIPAGLLYLHQSMNNTADNNAGTDYAYEVCEMNDVVPEDLYNRLVNLAEIKTEKSEKSKKLTRNKKNKLKKKRNTKRVAKY